MALEEALEGLTQVLEQMKAVGDLDGMWRPAARAFGILGRPVAADHLHPWMLLEPLGKGVSGALRKQINWLMLLKIDQDCPVDLPSPKRKVIDPQYAGCGRWRWWVVAGQAQ